MFKLITTSVLIISLSGILTACATAELTPIEKQKKQAELLERCKKLKKDMDDLKGKPLRRNASTQAYEDECWIRDQPNY